MEWFDPLYGSQEIDQPVLLALMDTRAVQRLAGVLQHGVTALLGITRMTSRLEHSVGVMLLARRMGAGLEEQVAALLHDISHTAFSHVIDYVFNDHQGQGYHERMKAPYLEGSDVPQVLSAFGFDWRVFLSEDRYPLLEQPAPALCADRLDYFLRDSLSLNLASADVVAQALGHLVVYQGRIVVDDLDAARWMARTYLAADDASWANFREVGLYELTARAIRIAMNLGVLTEADLWGSDLQAWQRMQVSAQPELSAAMAPISAQTRFEWDEENPTFWVSTKLRTIDPPVLLNGNPQPLSLLDADFARLQADYLKRKSGKWPVRVVPPPAG
jgi:HD superfamily phosphohydrolase